MSWLNGKPSPRDAAISDEIAGHIEERTEELVADSGLTRADAAAQARREFGNVALVEQDSRSTWHSEWFDTLSADVRYAVRTLKQSPGFTAIVILTLALGIGATTAIFSVVNAVLIRSLPFPHPSELVEIHSKSVMFDFSSLGVSLPDINDARAETTSLASVAAYNFGTHELGGDAKPERVNSLTVSAEFLPTLAVTPVAGRFFTPEEVKNKAHAVVLSYKLWADRFASDLGAVGKTLTLDGQSYNIIGVAPESLASVFNDPKLITPLEVREGDDLQRGQHNYQVIARLKPGATMQQVDAQLATLSARLSSSFPGPDEGWSMRAKSMKEILVGDARTPLMILLAATTLVLLIACANVSNLFLSRGWSRRREFAIRAALGASRGAILRQLFIENAIVALIGAALAFFIALWTTDALKHALPSNIPRLNEVHIDATVALFTLATALVATLLSGMAPALLGSRGDITATIKESGSGGHSGSAGTRHNVVRRLLVVAEVALAVMLLVSATLAIRSFLHLMRVNLGFQPNSIVTMRLDFPDYRFAKNGQREAFAKRVVDDVRGIDGVESASAGMAYPLGDMIAEGGYTTEMTLDKPDDQIPAARFNNIGTDFFHTFGIPIVRGRDFTAADTKEARSYILNEALARQAFGTLDVIGKRFTMGGRNADKTITWGTIVGVVGNEGDPRPDSKPQPTVYVPMSSDNGYDEMFLVVRAKAKALALVPAIEDRIWAANASQPIADINTEQQRLEEWNSAPRAQSILLGVFGGLGFVLALVGVYGVMSYLVSQQSREIAIRIALGAESGAIFRLVVGDGLKLALVGVVAGVCAALAFTRFMRTLIYGVSTTDPLTFTLVALAITAVAVLACAVPARRAMRVDPNSALRAE